MSDIKRRGGHRAIVTSWLSDVQAELVKPEPDLNFLSSLYLELQHQKESIDAFDSIIQENWPQEKPTAELEKEISECSRFRLKITSALNQIEN